MIQICDRIGKVAAEERWRGSGGSGLHWAVHIGIQQILSALPLKTCSSMRRSGRFAIQSLFSCFVNVASTCLRQWRVGWIPRLDRFRTASCVCGHSGCCRYVLSRGRGWWWGLEPCRRLSTGLGLWEGDKGNDGERLERLESLDNGCKMFVPSSPISQ